VTPEGVAHYLDWLTLTLGDLLRGVTGEDVPCQRRIEKKHRTAAQYLRRCKKAFEKHLETGSEAALFSVYILAFVAVCDLHGEAAARSKKPLEGLES
jgi:hypothetical protein